MHSTKQIILYTGPKENMAVAKKVFGDKFTILRAEPTPEDLLPKFAKCSAFLDASMKVRIPADAIKNAANLKIISTATTGADHIDIDALKERSIPILTLKGQKEILSNITAAAEHSWALLLASARRLNGAIPHVQNGGWNRTDFPGIMLKGKTLGVVGFGRIGSWMARYADAFGMKVLAHDPFVKEYSAYVKAVSMEELLKNSDFISLHVNYTQEVKGMLNADLIKLIKPGAVFINTSRGDLTDENVLVAALESGMISALAVDVLTGEPEIKQNPIWQYAQNHDNVIITPHIGGFCPEAVDIVVEFAARRILNFFETGKAV